MALLQAENIVAGYGSGGDILKGVSLTVEANQTYCIIGPNGAGKSTFLRVIAGLLPARDGHVTFKGEDITRLRADQVLTRGICFVPQDRSLFPDMSVQENLRMGGYVLNDRQEVQKRMDKVFEMFPILKERRTQRARTLSGGQQQMLAIGRTLIMEPEVIMLDEPSLGLAPKIARQIFEMVDELKTAGMTVIIVEQNARLGLEAADHGVVMDLGKNSFEASAEDVLSDPRIQELYLGRRASATS